mgnify:CR=1 FL=1
MSPLFEPGMCRGATSRGTLGDDSVSGSARQGALLHKGFGDLYGIECCSLA